MIKIDIKAVKVHTLKSKLSFMGPGAIITASFIGPKTITLALNAGANYGYAALWAIVFSVIASIVLHEMSARLGIITQRSLGEHFINVFEDERLNKIVKYLVLILITGSCVSLFSANIMGASIGLRTITGVSEKIFIPCVGIGILVVVLKCSTKILEKVLIALLGIVATISITIMILAKPNIAMILVASIVPTIPENSIITIIELIGTTLISYNLFLHTSLVSKKWDSPEELEPSRLDTIFHICIGGVIAASILVTSAALMGGIDVINIESISTQLEPLFGTWSKAFIGIGLLSAGLASAIAVPLGARYTLAGLLGWTLESYDKKIKITQINIFIVSIIISVVATSPMFIITASKAFNGVILPVVSILLVKITNDNKILGEYKNDILMQLIGSVVVLVTIFLGGYSIVSGLSLFV